MAVFAVWPNPLTFIAAVMVIGGRQLGLAILMHDAAHGLLFRTRRWNEFAGQWLRSEEHTSELQSLMRISYAVFFLKKKTEKIKLTHKNKHQILFKLIDTINNTK